MTDENKPTMRGQIFTVEDGTVVVEHYSFGEDVAYEYAVQVRFDVSGQAAMASALQLAEPHTPEMLLKVLKDRFGSYQAVRAFADEHGIAYEHRRDFQP